MQYTPNHPQLPFVPRLPEEKVREFMEVYKSATNKPISYNEAADMAHKLAILYTVLLSTPPEVLSELEKEA